MWKTSSSFMKSMPNFIISDRNSSSSVTSSKNFSICRTPNYCWVLHTIRKWMAKQKLSIATSSNIFSVLFISGHKNGAATYLGLSIGIIQHIIHFNRDDPFSSVVWTTTTLHSNVYWRTIFDARSWSTTHEPRWTATEIEDQLREISE